MTLYRGDDTNAFGNEFLTITLEDVDEDTVVTKAEFQCSSVLKIFLNPVFPLKVALTRSETKSLKDNNDCYLRVYDKDDLRQTCQGSISFETKKGVINAG